MTVKRANGTTIATPGDVDKTAWEADDPIYTMNETAYRVTAVPGGGASTATLLWNTGDRRRLSQIQAAFAADTTYPDTVPAPPHFPATINVTIDARYLGEDQSSGDSLGWTFDVTIDAVSPPRAVVVTIGGEDHALTTGTVSNDVSQFNSTSLQIQLTDTTSGLHAEHSMTVPPGQDATDTLTVDVP